jgi:hypothetical protein
MNARPLCLGSSKLGERGRVTEGDGVIIIPAPTIAILEVVNKFQTEDEMRGLSYHTNEKLGRRKPIPGRAKCQ